jgi:hypothetical protein
MPMNQLPKGVCDEQLINCVEKVQKKIGLHMFSILSTSRHASIRKGSQQHSSRRRSRRGRHHHPPKCDSYSRGLFLPEAQLVLFDIWAALGQIHFKELAHP